MPLHNLFGQLHAFEGEQPPPSHPKIKFHHKILFHLHERVCLQVLCLFILLKLAKTWCLWLVLGAKLFRYSKIKTTAKLRVKAEGRFSRIQLPPHPPPETTLPYKLNWLQHLCVVHLSLPLLPHSKIHEEKKKICFKMWKWISSYCSQLASLKPASPFAFYPTPLFLYSPVKYIFPSLLHLLQVTTFNLSLLSASVADNNSLPIPTRTWEASDTAVCCAHKVPPLFISELVPLHPAHLQLFLLSDTLRFSQEPSHPCFTSLK